MEGRKKALGKRAWGVGGRLVCKNHLRIDISLLNNAFSSAAHSQILQLISFSAASFLSLLEGNSVHAQRISRSSFIAAVLI